MNKNKEPFIQAIQSGDVEMVTALLKENPDLVRSKTEQGLSVLLLAMYYQKNEVVDILLKNKKDFDFFEAAAAGKLEILQKKLVENPDLLNRYSVDGFTALGLASFFSKKEIVEYLLEKGANPNIASDNSFRVAPLHSATAARQIEIVNILLRSGADVFAKQQNGVTALHSAAHLGEIEIVKILLANGADKEAKTQDGKTPLDFALADDFPEIIKILSV